MTWSGWRLAAVLAATPLLLTACHRKVDDPAAVSADEQAQLNDAAAMLDANAITANASDDTNTEDPS